MDYSYTDPYLLELIKEAMEDEAEAAKGYKEMSERAEDPDDKEVFNKIATDEQKHFKMLEEIYNKLNNSSVTPVITNSVKPVNFELDKKKIINKKIQNIEMYRVLYFGLKQPQFKNYVFEIMTDEQNHSLLMSK